jgi:hypothetical protein
VGIKYAAIAQRYAQQRSRYELKTVRRMDEAFPGHLFVNQRLETFMKGWQSLRMAARFPARGEAIALPAKFKSR